MEDEFDSPGILSAQATKEEFMEWKDRLLEYLKLDDDNKLFLRDGAYANWASLEEVEERKRIQELNIWYERGSKSIDNESSDQCSKELLARRNDQLNDFIELICELSNHLGNDAITDHATSVEMIFDILVEFLDLGRDTSTIIELSKMKHQPGEDYDAFYTRFRTSVANHVERCAKPDDDLTVDELISPTFEDVIILWCLEKIDPKLPTEVENNFGHLLLSTSLQKIKEQVFKVIPVMLGNEIGPIEEPFAEKSFNAEKSIKMESIEENEGCNYDSSRVIKVEPVREEHSQQTIDLSNQRVSKVTEFQCDGCNTVFSCINRLNQHKEKEDCDSQTLNMTCSICSRVFMKKGFLIKHMNDLHNIKSNVRVSHPCSLCGKIFFNTAKYREHRKSHVVPIESRIKCDICKCPILPQSMDAHKHKHHSELFCCGQFYISGVSLNLHRKSHSAVTAPVEQFFCPSCCSAHVSLESLEEHIKIFCLKSVDSQQSTSGSKESADTESYPEEQIFIKLEPRSQVDNDNPSSDNDSKEFVVINGIKCEKKTLSREVYSCIVCQKMLSTRENLEIHMRSHFPGAEQTELFAQLMVNMRPVQVFQTEALIPVPIEGTDPLEDMDVKLEVSDDVNDKDPGTEDTIVKKRVKRNPKEDNLATPQKEHPCEECGKVFNREVFIYSFGTLYQGKRLHSIHQVRHFGCICEECGTSFDSIKKLNYHTRTKHKPVEDVAQFVCSECGKSLCNKMTLLRHIERRHTPKSNIKEYSCEICGDLFNFEWQLKSHLAQHRRPKRQRYLTCNTCTRSFITEKDLADHVCKHYSCDVCEAKFLRERNLRFHKRVHRGETIYDCNKCEALFATKKRLNSHKNTTHSDKKKWVCTECPRAFKTSSGLKQHVLSHTGEKPVKCDLCDASFKTKAHLKSHRMIHNNKMPHQCNGCGLRFRELTSFKVHREKNTCGISEQDRYKGEEGVDLEDRYKADEEGANIVDQYVQAGDRFQAHDGSAGKIQQFLILTDQFQDM